MQQIGSKKTIAFNFADDMYYGDSDYSGWRCGTYTETSSKINLNMWENAYKAIRQTSIFLNNVDMNKELSAADIEDMKGQAHFLRAYFIGCLSVHLDRFLLFQMKPLIIRKIMMSYRLCGIHTMSVQSIYQMSW